MHPAVGLALSYVIGSIPSAFLAGKARGIDLRKHGSGNLGATNTYRVLGLRIALVVFLADVAKGVIPAVLLASLVPAGRPEVWGLAFGIAAIAGHVRSVFFLGREGGKGVATATGVFLGLAWQPTVVAMVVWAGVLAMTKYVSVASLAASVVLPVGLGVWGGWRSPAFLVSILVSVFVVWTHRENIRRLRLGVEHRIGEARAGGPPAANPS